MNLWLSDHQTWRIGHRGAPCIALENTLESFAAAIDSGLDGIELDVHVTADSVPVVYHDDMLTHPDSNLPIPLSDWSATALKSLALITGDRQYRLPTLAETLTLIGASSLHLNIELKSTIDPARVHLITQAVERHHLLGRVLFSSFELPLLEAVKRHCNGATAYVWAADSAWRPDPAYVDALNPHYCLLDESFIHWATEINKKIYTWTVDDAATAAQLTAWGVAGIISNRAPNSPETQFIRRSAVRAIVGLAAGV